MYKGLAHRAASHGNWISVNEKIKRVTQSGVLSFLRDQPFLDKMVLGRRFKMEMN